MTNEKQILDEFGKALMQRVRDSCYEEFEKILSGDIRSKSALTIQKKVSEFDINEINIIKIIVRDSIDSTIHRLLWLIEQDEFFDLIKYAGDKKSFFSLREISDGLCGELYSDMGWIEMYSRYPSNFK